MEIFDRLSRHARDMPARPAVLAGDDGADASGCLTYAQLHRAVWQIAADLRARQVEGRAVILSCQNRPGFVAAFLGILGAGGTVFPVSGALTSAELERAVVESAAIGAIADAPHAGRLAACGLWTVSPDGLLRSGPSAPGDGHTDPGRLYLQSSGTTGLPKIASRSAVSLDAVARNVAAAVGLTPADTVLGAVPMSHSYGVENVVLAPIWAGASVRALAAPEPALLDGLLRRGGVTVFPGVPFMFEVLAAMGIARRAGRGENGPESGCLRTVYSAGASLPAGVATRFADAWGLRIGQLYGATEIGSVTFSDAADPGADAASVGLPMNGVEIRVVEPDDPRPRRAVPPGVEGHVLVRAPSMLDGYVGAEAPMVEGFFQTADLGRLDTAGRLSITGRLKLLIDVGGLKVNPLEVEAVLAGHPQVRECVVVPVRVSDTVSRLRAVVTARDGAVDVEGVRAHARQSLASYKVPRIIEVRQALPKSPTGKILRRQVEAEGGV